MGFSHGIRWDDERIESEIKKTMTLLNINYFPTHSEMIKLYGNRSLTCAVSKHGGTEYWSKKLDIPIKKSETSFGDKYEKYAITDIFRHTGLNSIQTSTRHAYDLLVDDCVKIDVKASSINEKSNGDTQYYSFNLEKKEFTCDIFLFYGINNDGNIGKTILIPAVALSGQTQIGFTVHDSVWDWYMNKWEIIIEYKNFMDKYRTPNKLEKKRYLNYE